MSASAGRQIMVTGRLVWTSGDLFKGRVKTIYGTQTPKLDKLGQPMQEYGFGLAVNKAKMQDPNSPEAALWNALHEEAYVVNTNRQIPANFAMKFKDGDVDMDNKGVPFAQRTGYAGCIVLSCTTTLPIQFFKWDDTAGQNVMINQGIECGYHVDVQLTIKSHGDPNAGLYLNPNSVRFNSFDEVIVNAPSGDQIFGAVAPMAAPGGSVTPLTPTGAAAAMPQAAVAPAPIQPNYNVLPQAHQPQAAQPVAAPAPASVVAMPVVQAPVAQQPATAMPAMPGVPFPGQG